MNSTDNAPQKKPGEQLIQAERNILIGKMLDYMIEGYYSTNALAKKLRVSRGTVERYRPIVDDLIAKTKIDRNAIRALQIRRTYEIIEQLMDDLANSKSREDRTGYYNQIYKFSSHLALITGLNVETQVHVDPTKLVIIRANKDKPNKKVDYEMDAPEDKLLPQLADTE